MVFRVYVCKKPGLAPEAAGLLADCRSFLGLSALEDVRIWNRYDAEGLDEELFNYAKGTVFSEPQIDDVMDEVNAEGAAVEFAVEPFQSFIKLYFYVFPLSVCEVLGFSQLHV